MGSTRVGPQARREYLTRMRERYETAARAAKSRLLDEVCEVTGYHRKAAIRLLRRRAGPRGRGRRRPVRYGSTVVGTLRRIWEAAGCPWSLRLQALLPTWLPYATRRLASVTFCISRPRGWRRPRTSTTPASTCGERRRDCRDRLTGSGAHGTSSTIPQVRPGA